MVQVAQKRGVEHRSFVDDDNVGACSAIADVTMDEVVDRVAAGHVGRDVRLRDDLHTLPGRAQPEDALGEEGRLPHAGRP